MSRPYRPAPWLSNPHLHTVWGRLFRRPPRLPWRQERWDTPDDDFVDLLRLDASDPTAPTFLLLHGLEGSHRSHYIGATLENAWSRGWQANLLFFRSCSGETNRQARSYHSGDTADVDHVIRRLIAERPGASLVLAGVSLGGNVLLKWLGEQGEAAQGIVAAATATSVPFDLARSCDHIDRTATFYSRRFLRTLRRKALDKVARHPGIADPGAISRATTLWAFDDAFTSVVHGFADAADYYARSSSMAYLASVRVPTLLLSARDDPFHPPEVLADVAKIAAGNPWLRTEFVPVGGHVGFVEGAVPWATSSYSDRRAVEFAAEFLPMSRTDGRS
ncbi:MAG: alpha/beta fold hydrolase [Cytophagaceae bacterium]|nr:alpha/beta fold hydrolase [Gemmatimonadaceae bacterium]